jgi:hypothetical protein
VFAPFFAPFPGVPALSKQAGEEAESGAGDRSDMDDPEDKVPMPEKAPPYLRGYKISNQTVPNGDYETIGPMVSHQQCQEAYLNGAGTQKNAEGTEIGLSASHHHRVRYTVCY